ncbi:hypothetical protein ACFL54_01635 [Planctomycetota bacterium]
MRTTRGLLCLVMLAGLAVFWLCSCGAEPGPSQEELDAQAKAEKQAAITKCKRKLTEVYEARQADIRRQDVEKYISTLNDCGADGKEIARKIKARADAEWAEQRKTALVMKIRKEAPHYAHYLVRKNAPDKYSKGDYASKFQAKKELIDKFAQELDDLGYDVDVEAILKKAVAKARKNHKLREVEKGDIRDDFGP